MNSPASIQDIHYTFERVMLVDDSRVDNFINQRIISTYRFAKEIEVYTSPVKALEKLTAINNYIFPDSEIPSYLFLDLNMPEIDGHDFLEEFSKLSDRIKNECRIVILTSSADPNEFVRLRLTPGVAATLSKPLIKSNLEELIGLSNTYRLVV